MRPEYGNKPHLIYIASRKWGNFYEAIIKQNQIANHPKPAKEEQAAFQSSMNSCLGIFHPVKFNKVGAKQFNRRKHYRTYKLRKRMLIKNLSGWCWNYFYPVGYEKFVMKRKVVNKLSNGVNLSRGIGRFVRNEHLG